MPASSDAGTSLGAALHVAHVLGDDDVADHPQTDYLGTSFTDDEVEAALKRAGATFARPDAIANAVADLLAGGHIVGWFQGRMELGPRALGCRSILADPRRADMKDVLNARVKFREWFRPFAPSILAERCGEFFERDEISPYMLQVYKTRPEHREKLASVTHVDGGARVQTVTREQNAPYYDLISAFDARTGVPVVLNTSFNIRGEPIVATVEDALKCFYTTDMDALAVGPFLLTK